MNGMGRAVEDEDHRHGLFTYYLLRALSGESDVNRDGEVTLGEAVAYVRQKVLWASKTQYGQEQRPAVFPSLKTTDPVSGLALAKLAAVRALNNPNSPGERAQKGVEDTVLHPFYVLRRLNYSSPLQKLRS